MILDGALCDSKTYIETQKKDVLKTIPEYTLKSKKN